MYSLYLLSLLVGHFYLLVIELSISISSMLLQLPSFFLPFQILLHSPCPQVTKMPCCFERHAYLSQQGSHFQAKKILYCTSCTVYFVILNTSGDTISYILYSTEYSSLCLSHGSHIDSTFSFATFPLNISCFLYAGFQSSFTF